MSRTKLFRLALAEFPDAPAAELLSFIQEKYGVRIDPRFIPVLRASLQDLEKLNRLRQAVKPAQPA